MLDSWKDRLRLRWARDLPLVHLAAILGQCALFIGHDSGISHIAAAVGTPSLLMFGGTDPKVWAPQNPNVKSVKAPDGNLEVLELETVLQAIREILL